MRTTIARVTWVIMICSAALIVKTNTSGPGWSLTNAPITGTSKESNCTNCHSSFSLQTSGTNHGKINLSQNFTGNGYIPDSTYTLVLGYKETGKSKFGFQMTCLEANSYKAAGTFTNGDSRSQTGTGVVGGNTRYYIGHTGSGTGTVSSDSTAWKISWKAPSKNVGKVTFWITLNVADGSGSNGDYIYSKSFTFSPSTLLPSAKAKITDPNICAGTNLNFAADVTGSPSTYTWSFPSGTPSSSTSSTPKISYTNAGTYKAYVTVANSKGASLQDTLTFTVKARPAQPVVSPGTIQNICAGDSVSLTTSTASGVTYLWSPGGKTSRILTVKTAGSYAVVVTSTTNGCSSAPSTAVTVNVNPTPALDVTVTKDTQCSKSPIIINASRKNAFADSFSFAGNKGPWGKDSSISTSLNAGKQWVKAWAKSLKGCIASDSASVEVLSPQKAPVLSTGNATLKGFTVNWTSIAKATGYRISLDSGKTYQVPSSGNSGLSHIIQTMKAGEALQARVKALVSDPCGETEFAEITGIADTCRSIPFTISVAKNKVCRLDKAQITIRGLKGLNYGIRINNTNIGKDTLFTPIVYGTTTFKVEVIDSAKLDCGYSSQNTTIYEDSIESPVTSLNNDKDRKLCSNQTSVALTVTANAAQFQDSVIWYLNGKRDGNGLIHNYNVRQGDMVYAMSKNKGGCQATTPATSIIIQKIPDATFTISNTATVYQFNANTTGDKHTWISPVSISSTTASASADFKDYQGKSVTVKHIVLLNGCESEDSVAIPVINLGIANMRNRHQVVIAPNPTSDYVQITCQESLTGELRLTDMIGKTMLTRQLSGSVTQLTVAHLPAGTYFLQIITQKGPSMHQLSIND